MKVKFLIPLVAGLFLASIAHATTVTHYSGAAVAGSSYTNFSIAKFDSSLGTLTGVTVFVSTADLQGSLGITNNDASSAAIDGYDSTFNIRQSVGTDLGYGSTKSDTITDIVTTPAWSGVTLASGGQQTLTIGGGQSFSIASVDVASAVFGAYQSADGTGSVTFQARTTQSLSVTGGNFTANSTGVSANTNVGVTYTYTEAIPEPSAFALLGLGALGLVARRRRIA
jgi:hypothetical protein